MQHMTRRSNSKLGWLLSKHRIGAIIIVILFLFALRQLISSQMELSKSSVKDDIFNQDNDYLGHRNDESKGKSQNKHVGPIVDIRIDKKIEGKTGLTASGFAFFLDGKPFRIFGGAIHYYRFPHQYWRNRLLALKAAGLNTVTTYIAWNAHEPRKGEYDFTGMYDLAKFVQIADDLDLYVILRVGPYICAEWEWGGLPSWLLRGGQIEVRTSDLVYMNHVQDWFNVLLPVIKPFQYTHGGPVIAVQVENEYAAFPTFDSKYVLKLKEMVIKGGIEEFLFVCDDQHGALRKDMTFDYGGMMKSINFQHDPKRVFDELRIKQPNWPLFVSEYWTGWFNVWGQPDNYLGVPWLNSFDVPTFENTTKQIIDIGANINLYVFAGGTNFGFMNGGMIPEKFRGKGDRTSPDTTSYDYSAPISEEGKLTPKYFVTRKLMQKFDPSKKLIEPPPQPELAEYDSIGIQSYVTLGSLLVAMKSWMIKSKHPMTMENFPAASDRKIGQAYGYAMYEATVEDKSSFKFNFAGLIRDRALVYMDTIYQETVVPPMGELTLRATGNTRHTISFLVENQGRVNWVSKEQVGTMENQQKGILGDIKCDGKILEDWRIWPLEFDSQFMNKLHKLTSDGDLKWMTTPLSSASTPVLLKTYLKLGSGLIKDTFIELEGFEKGVLIVNNINIGRYWNSAGPQKRLFLPGVWLKPGDNEILIFEESVIGTKLSFHNTNGVIHFATPKRPQKL